MTAATTPADWAAEVLGLSAAACPLLGPLGRIGLLSVLPWALMIWIFRTDGLQ